MVHHLSSLIRNMYRYPHLHYYRTSPPLSIAKYGLLQCLCAHCLATVRLLNGDIDLYLACSLFLPQVPLPPYPTCYRCDSPGTRFGLIHARQPILGYGRQQILAGSVKYDVSNVFSRIRFNVRLHGHEN